MARLLIVDGHAYAYRAFHAIRELRSAAGQPTNAIYGFIKMLAKMRATLSPTHLIVVWDGGLCAERLTALPEYKAHRPGMPADLRPQIDEIVRYLEAANIASFCRDGVEADDYIACLASRAVSGINADMEVVIASSDKDFMQLVTGDPPREINGGHAVGQNTLPISRGKAKGERLNAKVSLQPSALSLQHSPVIGLLNPNDKTETVWTAEQVRAKTGVEPSQIVDWLSLIGDSVDNIPGVPGVGPKTAADLLQQFGSVAALYGRLDEVKSERLRAALTAAADAVRRNRELVRLREDLPCEFSPQEMAGQPADADRLAPLFRQWSFRSLLAELEASREVGDTGQVTRDTILPKASCHVSPVTCHPTQAVLL